MASMRVRDNEDMRPLIQAVAEDNQSVPQLQFIRDDPQGAIIKKLGPGINCVYGVMSKDGKNSVVIKKYRDTFMRNRPIALPPERPQLEYDGLVLMNALEKGRAPVPYCLDTRHRVLVMEELSGCELLWNQLKKGYVNVEVADDLGRLLGRLHKATSKRNLSPDRWSELEKKFRKPEVQDFFSTLMHADQYNGDGNNDENISINASFAINTIKKKGYDRKLVAMFRQEQCFVHADCHMKSVFVKEHKATLIDFEFGFLGHPAVNIAFIIESYVRTYIINLFTKKRSSRETYRGHYDSSKVKARTIRAITTLVTAYLDTRVDLAEFDNEESEFFSLLALFTGSFMFYMGHPGSPLHRLHDEIKETFMDKGAKLINAHESVTTFHQFIELLQSQTMMDKHGGGANAYQD